MLLPILLPTWSAGSGLQSLVGGLFLFVLFTNWTCNQGQSSPDVTTTSEKLPWCLVMCPASLDLPSLSLSQWEITCWLKSTVCICYTDFKQCKRCVLYICMGQWLDLVQYGVWLIPKKAGDNIDRQYAHFSQNEDACYDRLQVLPEKYKHLQRMSPSNIPWGAS